MDIAIKEFFPILSNSDLFCNMNKTELKATLSYFKAESQSYRKGDILVGTGEKMNKFGFVLKGSVQVVVDDINGDRVIMANVSEGVTFGESLCYTGRVSGIYVVATTEALVMWLSCDNLLLGENPNPEAEARFVRLLANRALSMNDRIQVLSKKSLRAKLNAFFTQCLIQNNSTDFYLDMDRESMAAYLGIDRSALSRELSKMRAEGLIDFRKNHFCLLKANLNGGNK